MGLFKKKVSKTERVLDFNKNKLREEIENLSSKLYPLRQDLALQIIKEVIEMAKNVQILEVNSYKSESDLLIHRGRLQALSDLASYIERSMTNKPTEEGAPKARDTIKTRRFSSTAGAAI